MQQVDINNTNPLPGFLHNHTSYFIFNCGKVYEYSRNKECAQCAQIEVCAVLFHVLIMIPLEKRRDVCL